VKYFLRRGGFEGKGLTTEVPPNEWLAWEAVLDATWMITDVGLRIRAH
jgi:hypothetical protein